MFDVCMSCTVHRRISQRSIGAKQVGDEDMKKMSRLGILGF